MIFDELPRNHFGAIYADPPWHYEVWSEGSSRTASSKYAVMTTAEIAAMPILDLAAPDCVLFMWITWPKAREAWDVLDGWGFIYKTCAFAWLKADVSTIDLFSDPKQSDMLMGSWTRANSEVCLLATRGHPKRLHADVRQGIIEPRREHSRKPDCVYGRIERLVAGPYLGLIARTTRPGWTAWGNEVGKFREVV